MKMATDESKQEIDADVVPTTDGQPSNIEHMTGAVAAAEQKLVPNSNVIPERFSPTMRQTISALGPIMSSMGGGMTAGYSAILLPELMKETSEIRITLDQKSWIASVAPLLMAIGCLIGGVMIQRYGRRMTLLILNFPFVLGWVVLSMSTNIEMIMVGRLVTGLCTGLLGPAAPIFIGETSAPALRGFLLAGITFAVSLGVFLVHTLGWFCTWQTTAVISGICPFISYILVGQVPESPSWLLSQNRTDEAAAAFKWFRGHDPEAVAEFKSMVEGQKFQEAKGNLTNYSIYSWTRMKESFSTHTFLQPLFILLVFFGTMQGTGINVIIFYSVTIVEQVFGDGINKYVATFITDLLRLAVSIMACVIIRRVGRRSLLTYSGIATALSLFALSLYLFLVNEYVELKTMPWIPLVILLAYVAAVTIGMNPLPWCVVGELFATEHRALGSALVTQFNFISMFASVKSSPFLFEHYGIGNAFLIYGIITVCGMVYLLMYLPETRNRSLLEIENEFRTRRTGTTNKVSAA